MGAKDLKQKYMNSFLLGREGLQKMKYEFDLLKIQVQYKEILQVLMNKGNLETVLFLRILMETGIRSTDVYELDPGCIQQRKVTIMDSKRQRYYEVGGQSPRISKRTEQIAKILMRKQGKYFTESLSYYREKIMRYSRDHHWLQVHYLRHYRSKVAYELRYELR